MEYSSSEEWKAYQILSDINRYYSELNGCHFTEDRETVTFPIEFLEEINFEIVNRKDLKNNKRKLLIITNTYKSVDLKLLHVHMMLLGIKKRFVDKSIPFDGIDLDTKRYLVVYPKLKENDFESSSYNFSPS